MTDRLNSEVAARRDEAALLREQGGEWTVVTARSGPLRGTRVVRGREGECQARRAEFQSTLDRDQGFEPGDTP